MSRTLNRLKPLTVERAKTPGRYADGGGNETAEERVALAGARLANLIEAALQ